MASKDIYRIDNYFIAIGSALLIVGLLSLALDPRNWSDVVIKKIENKTTHYSWDNRNGRTLEQIRLEKGAGYVVEDVVRGFPLIRLILIANGFVLLFIGYAYRSRENKVIAVWNALEHAGEARVDGLSVSLGLSRDFILKHLKDINARRQSAYIYDSRSDKIINARLQNEFLIFVDCANCGHKINEKVSLDLSNPPRCRYCGTGVSAEHLNNLKRDVLANMQAAPSAAAAAVADGSSGKINIAVLVALMIFFWPAAVIYLVKKKAFS